MTPETLLDRIVAAPASTALLVDFDGVLAPIVRDPSAARALPGAGPALEELSARLHTVAAVSGRPLSFLETHLPPGLDLVGLYGLERRIAGHRSDHVNAGSWREVIADVAASAAHGPERMVTESKGLSLTVHYRGAPEIGPEVEAWAAAQAARSGLRARAAKMSVELHPPIDVDKGSVVDELGAEASLVLYAGDDLGDLAAFDGLDRHEARGAATVRIAVGGAELPAELAARAQLHFDGPEAFTSMLATLAERLR